MVGFRLLWATGARPMDIRQSRASTEVRTREGLL